MMKTVQKIFIAASLVSVVFAGEVYSQASKVVYFMKVPQNHMLNPALKPANRFYLGLPVFSGAYAGIGNNFISLTDIVVPGVKSDEIFTFQDPDFDLNQIGEKLKRSNTITIEAGIPLLGLGFPVGKNYSIFFDIADRISAKAVFPRELMDLYVTGASDFINKTIDISNLKITGQYYREYGLGFSGNILKDLRIGAKIKLLSGMTSINFDNRLFSLKVNSDLSQTLTANASLDIAGQETMRRIFSSNNILFGSGGGGNSDFAGFLSEYLFNPVINSGAAIDLGAVYTLGSLFTFSASVTDLGFINWKEELEGYSSSGTFNLPGITLEDVVNQTYSIEEMMGALEDTLKSRFRAVDSPQPFRTYLPSTILAGGSVNVFPFLSLGILSESKIYAGNLKQSLILSGNFYAGRTLSASLSYAMSNSSYNNLGLGIAVKAGFAQIYLIADKIPLDWEKVYIKKSDTQYAGLPLPKNMNMLSLQLGINIVFGKPVTKKTDTPMLLEEKID
jgi:hypothetical protein